MATISHENLYLLAYNLVSCPPILSLEVVTCLTEIDSRRILSTSTLWHFVHFVSTQHSVLLFLMDAALAQLVDAAANADLYVVLRVLATGEVKADDIDNEGESTRKYHGLVD